MRVPLAVRGEVPIGPKASRGVRKGLFSQGVALLFEQAPTLQQLRAALGGFDVLRELEPASEWVFGGQSLILDYRQALNGLVQVDVVDRPWPDAMGNTADEVTLFGAWSTGHFGPTTFPFALERARQHAWTWKEGAALAARHRAFVRVRLSYVFGAGKDALVQPPGTDPVDELRFVSAVQLALASVPGFLALFNPSGERLAPPEQLEAALARDLAGKGLPVDVWTNVRMFRPAELNGDWLLFDTPGMGQLDVVDHEFVVPKDHPSAQLVPGLALSICDYDANQRGVIGAGDTAADDGGAQWRAYAAGDGRVDPPRPVLRWSLQGVEVPDALK